MKIRLHIATIDAGDGSSYVNIFPSERKLREELRLDDDDCKHDEDGTLIDGIPVEISTKIIDISEYEVVTD